VTGRYLVALAVTLVLEVPIVAACFPGRRLRMAWTCALATTSTHLFMHFVMPRWLAGPQQVIVAGEVLALVAEAAVYAVAVRELGRALVASALANAASYGAGLLLVARGWL
jgi:hypothetical protein